MTRYIRLIALWVVITAIGWVVLAQTPLWDPPTDIGEFTYRIAAGIGFYYIGVWLGTLVGAVITYIYERRRARCHPLAYLAALDHAFSIRADKP